jgi:hypothetical protein
MKTLRTLSILFALLVVASLRAGEIGFLEDFALSPDRAVPIKQLIPGTEDYYYYHCLQYQHKGEHAKVREFLGQWIKRHNVTSRVREIQDRQALLEYGENPGKSLAHIRDRLKLRFDHQRKLADRKTDHPSALNPVLITRATLTKRALSKHKNLNGFEDAALEFLVGEELNPDRRRHLLQRLKRPDYPGMARLVVDDLRYKHSRGFGSHGIHRSLLHTQLDECLKLMPELIKNTNFINVYLSKLRPGDDVDWRYEADEKLAFLERQWTFVKGLPPAQNSLKAHVLYQRLLFDRSRGIHDKARFSEYLKLPRNVPYINRDYANRPEHRHHRASLGANFQAHSMHPPVGNEEPLVRDFLMQFLKDAENTREFDDYIEHNYLKELFAETKIVNGIGDMEQWYSLLPPARYKALKERVDIDFLPTNPKILQPAERVELAVAVKNVKNLIAKVYEINTRNYYREHQTEITTAIDLDGLVANVERDVAFDQVALRRHVERLAFPEIDGPGLYIVELIGNGKSSRALIRKGRLTFTERAGAAGHVFTIYDSDNRRLEDARILLAGTAYEPDEQGEIAVPFSANANSQKLILVHRDFAALHTFHHRAETYSLNAGIYVDREMLVAGETCEVLVRPELRVSGTRADISLLEEVTLVIDSVDQDGIRSSKTVADFKLNNDGESTYTFKVPDNLSGISIALRAKVQNLSRNKKEDLVASVSYPVNGINKTDKIEDLHLSHEAGQYFLSVLGKTGEVRADRPVHVELKHRDFTESVHATLQSGDDGRIALGELADILIVGVRGTEGTQRSWRLIEDGHTHPGAVHALAGDEILVPYMGENDVRPVDALSVIETRRGTFVRDVIGTATLAGGFIRLKGLAPGDYDLLIKDSATHVSIRVTAGRREGSVLLSRDRYLEGGEARPLQILSVAPDKAGKDIVVQLANATDAARVHVVASRFVPGQTLFAGLGAPATSSLQAGWLGRKASLYLSGRRIGDEYRYILERKYAAKYPGNMLRRPGLLLNPWSIRKTETGTDKVMGGEAWGIAADEELQERLGKRRYGGKAESAKASGGSRGFSTLDYLPSTSLVLSNLKPDGEGRVRVSIEDIGPRRQLQVLALDLNDAAYRETSIAPEGEQYKDLRLARVFPADGHLTEQKKVSAVSAGKVFTIRDIKSSKIEVYDSLAGVYRLFSTLSGNATLAEFGFIIGWPELKPEEKRRLYSKYACHELSFFLHEKDPDFFEAVVLPHVRNKKDKTFMDHWLIGAELADYRRPWSYGRLNIVERILLAERDDGERAATARHVTDLYDLVPPDIDHLNRLFKTAIRGSALETKDNLGLERALKQAEIADMDMDGAVALSGLVAGGGRERARPAAVPAPPAPSAKPASRMAALKLAVNKDEISLIDEPEALFDAVEKKSLKSDLRRRKHVRQLYRKLDKTEEWVENNYYHLSIAQQIGSLVTAGAFWKDYAARDPEKPFLSEHIAEAARSFTEMMLAMAVLDLPFKAAEHDARYENAAMALTPGSPVIVFHKEARETEAPRDAPSVLVSQNFFARDDRYRHEGNERFDRFVTQEFRSQRVYGCQVVLTNPSSGRRKVDILLQVPRGAIPAVNGFYTRSIHMQLDPYSTKSFEYYFYFPGAGTFAHYPVHVAQNEKLIAFTKPFSFNVVETLTQVDKTSWPYISQNGTSEQVLRYLRDNNIDRLDLAQIAFRMRDAAFFQAAVPLLQGRHVYNDTLWSYGLHHNDPAVMREFLRHSRYAQGCGLYIESALLSLDPVARHAYEHKEYWPLVNARTCQLGERRKILNSQFYEQYMRLMKVLSYRPKLDDADRLGVLYYLLLQDRVEEALATFAAVKSDGIATRLQYDYAKAYLAFYREKPEEAKQIAAAYRDYPVDRWKKLFLDVIAQADEIADKAVTVVDDEDRTQVQTQLADTAPTFDFTVENGTVEITHRNLKACRVNLYAMDIELLFSRNPFVQEVSGQFAVIKPNAIIKVNLEKAEGPKKLALPEAFRDRNVMVEVEAAGKAESKAYYPHTLNVELTENYGQVRVLHGKTRKPLPKVYVKTYARIKGGEIRFFKDGYTDLRGRFDYTSLSTDELQRVEKLSLLILSDTHGAVVREASPPKM